MPRHLRLFSLLPLILLVVALSCTERSVSEASDPVEEALPVVLPPFRMVLVSSRDLAATKVLPEGMVTVVKQGPGRLNASSPTWKTLVNLSEDESIRAVVVADAPQGTAALFSELKELRPDLHLLALAPVESPLVIQAAADIVMDFDHVMRAYSAVLIAARMGRKSIVLLSMPGPNEDWRFNTRQAVLRAASTDMGVTFKTLVVNPDGLEKALRGLDIEVGPDIATVPAIPSGSATGTVMVVNDGRLASEAVRIAVASGAMFIELDRPEDGYAGTAVGTEAPSEAAGGPARVTASTLKDGDSVRTWIDTARNVPGRPGLTLIWPGEQASLMELGALVFAKSVVDGKPASEGSLAAVMNTVWPTGQWHASHYIDPQTGVRARNHLLIGADPYLVGRSYLSSESRFMPSKYRQIPER